MQQSFYSRPEFVKYNLGQVQHAMAQQGLASRQKNKGKGAKQDICHYLNQKYDHDFNKLNSALEKNLSQKDPFMIDKFLDNLPDLSLKDWQAKISIAPLIVSNGSVTE